MARQLTLLDTPPAWRIDAATREAGRRGIAEARASLRAALAGDGRDRAETGERPQRSSDRTAA